MEICVYCGNQFGFNQQFCSSCGKNRSPLQNQNQQRSRLTKSHHEKMIAGVCGGIAEHYNMDPSMVRLAFILFSILGGSGVLLYIILVLIIPHPFVPYKQ